MNKEKLKSVHDQDIERLLEKLGIWGKLKHRKLKCTFCKTIITLENLHSLFPRSGGIKIVCDKMECTRELSNLLREGGVSL